MVPRAAGAIQGATACGVRRAAEDLDVQDPEVPLARDGESGGWSRSWLMGLQKTHTPPDGGQRRISRDAGAANAPVAFRSVSRELRLQANHFIFKLQLLSLQFRDLLVRRAWVRKRILKFALQSLVLGCEFAQMRLK